MTTTDLSWFKSSYSSGDGDNCVEVATQAHAIHVRDSKDANLRPLTISPSAWAAFTAHAVEVEQP
ncbi:DUF397 domain-containing protein [Streptomyces spirodelae]|uniref:DUF397 domain-containing protein n=1 Tax=Streptomyces spirodelae TaxID=2812904 RepID=A0ABS3WPY0_9ACTN|nr:DUF397 domain-containing protein [Streptomyces spirodelae]MBO8184956.1 DUF397 domain-containing protein [Streptomyces spirodelae]